MDVDPDTLVSRARAGRSSSSDIGERVLDWSIGRTFATPASRWTRPGPIVGATPWAFTLRL
jgi:hypothetical protein